MTEPQTSKSTKSASPSPPSFPSPGKKEPPRLSRTMRRQVDFVPLAPDHMRYFWAAYRMGTWKALDVQDDLGRDEFVGFMESLGDGMNVITAPSKDGTAPVALVWHREDPRLIEPHVDWFPWATHRNRLEGMIAMVQSLREIKPLLLICRKQDTKFFTHIARYGLLRRIGKFYGDEEYAMFQSYVKDRVKWSVQ